MINNIKKIVNYKPILIGHLINIGKFNSNKFSLCSKIRRIININNANFNNDFFLLVYPKLNTENFLFMEVNFESNKLNLLVKIYFIKFFTF